MNIILLGIGHVKQSENENTGYKRGQKYLSICSGNCMRYERWREEAGEDKNLHKSRKVRRIFRDRIVSLRKILKDD